MNRFFKIVGVLVVMLVSTAVFADGGRDNDRRDGDRGRGDNHQREVPGMYHHPHSYPYVIGDAGPGAVQVGVGVGVLEPVPPLIRIFGVVIVGQPNGHWEDRIIGYQTELRPVYHPAVLGAYWNGNQYIQYVVTPEHWGPDMTPVPIPIYQRVWVS